MIDFSPIRSGEVKYLEFAARFTLLDLKKAANESIDYLLGIVKDMTDADVTFDPIDLEAHDPYAKEGEQNIGWSIAHLVAHVTASTEEWAAYSSILARGIPYVPEPRLRYETPWRDITTAEQTIQRLEESRRIRLSYLNTWPDKPHLDTRRELSPRFIERYGEFNAPAAFLFGLAHEVGHYNQFKEVARQIAEVNERAKA